MRIQKPRTSIALLFALQLAVYAVLFTGFLSKHEWNPTALFRVGRHFAAPLRVAANNNYIYPTHGHDGQFVYFLAANPLPSPDTLSHIDAPLYRARRIGLSATAWLLSLGGRAEWLPFVLPLANTAVCIVAGTLLGVALARRGRSPFLACLWTFGFSTVSSVLHTLPDAYAASWALLGLLLADRRPIAAWLCLAFSVLCKEVYVAVAVGLAIEVGLGGRRLRALGLCSVVLPFVAWAVFLSWYTGRSSTPEEVTNNLGWPLLGWWQTLQAWAGSVRGFRGWWKLAVGTLIPMLLLVFLAVQVGMSSVRRRNYPWRVIALLQLALMVCLTPSVLSHRDNFARVLILIPLLALHDYSYRGGRTRIGALAWLCCYGLLVAPGFL